MTTLDLPSQDRSNRLSHHPTRRRFLKAGSVSALGCAGGLGLASAPIVGAPPLDKRIKLAVKYSMIQDRISVLAKFKMLKGSGFDGTEFKLTNKPEQKQILHAIDQTGIVAHGIIHGNSDDYIEAIDFCKQLGGSSVLIVAREVKDLPYRENFVLAQTFIRKAMHHAEKRGIRILIENVRASFLKKAEEMARFIDELKSPVVGAYFDTGNAITWTNQPAEYWARVLGSRIVKVDVKDRGHAEFGDPKTRRKGVVGTHGGEVNWAAVQQELKKINFNGWATAEVKGGNSERIHGIFEWMTDLMCNKTSASR